MPFREHGESNLLVPNIIRPRQYSKKQPCVYCGGNNTSKDHVLPRTIYRVVDRKSVQLLTVGSCHHCNSDKKAKLDTFLRDCLVVDIDVQQHPIAKELFGTDLLRALEAGHTTTFKNFNNGEAKVLRSWDGSGWELGWAIEVDEQCLLSAIRYITQGMHWNTYGELTSQDSVTAFLIPREERHGFMKRSSEMNMFQGYFKQGEQFTSAFGQAEDGRVIWHHVFFDTMLFVAFSQGSVPTMSSS